MSLRIAVDTNVLVSAFIAAGPPSRIVEEAIDGRLEMVVLEPVIDELHRILTEKLGFEESKWVEVEALLASLASVVVPAPEGLVEPVTGDPDDDVILACAVEARVDALISGDRNHLLPIQRHRGVRIESPQAILAELRGH